MNNTTIVRSTSLYAMADILGVELNSHGNVKTHPAPYLYGPLGLVLPLEMKLSHIIPGQTCDVGCYKISGRLYVAIIVPVDTTAPLVVLVMDKSLGQDTNLAMSARKRFAEGSASIAVTAQSYIEWAKSATVAAYTTYVGQLGKYHKAAIS